MKHRKKETNLFPIRFILLSVLSLALISCAAISGNLYPLDKAYRNDQSLRQEIRDIVRTYPQKVKLHRLGSSSTEDLPIFALETGRGDRQILMIGQNHGDEVLGVEIVMRWLLLLLQRSESDPRIKELLDIYTFWIIPTTNPEGYRVVSQGLYPYKRKNNRDTDGNKILDYATDGVDLNRNFPVFWDVDPLTPTTSPYYKGSAPASEPETRAVMNLASRIPFEIAIFYHSSVTGAYSEKLYLPWHNHHDQDQAVLYDELLKVAQIYASRLTKDYTDGLYEVHTGATTRVGNARNYFFHTHQTRAFLIEVGGVNQLGISVIHPSGKKMRQIVQKHLSALQALFLDLIPPGV